MLWLTRLWLRSNPGQYQGIHRGKRKLWDVDQAINLHGLRIDHLQVRRLPLGKIACQSDQHPLAYSPQTLFQQRPNVARAGQVQHTIEIALTLEHGHDAVVFRLRLGRALVFECKQKLAATQRKCNDCVVILRVLDVGQFVAAPDLCEQADVHGVHRRNHARLLQHVAVVGTSADRATEVLQRSHVRKELVQFLPNVVVERADPVRWSSRNLQWEIGNPPDALELEPWSGANFLADLANLLLIRLDAPFELVERLLQFDRATIREIGPACCQARRLEVGDDADRITLRRIRDLRQVPPRGLFLALFVLRVFPGWRVPEPIFYEQRESRSLDDANPVEVIEIGR